MAEEIKRRLGEAWRDEPRFEGVARPKVIEILRLLPKTNCGQCASPHACFANPGGQIGGRGPELSIKKTKNLKRNLSQFRFADANRKGVENRKNGRESENLKSCSFAQGIPAVAKWLKAGRGN